MIITKIYRYAIFIICTFSVLSSAQAQKKSDSSFQQMMQDSFRTEGSASIDRIQQDITQQFCSDPALIKSKAGERKAVEIQKWNLATIQAPMDGKYLGDWKSGEAIAQSGRGVTWSDTSATANGGGCYNCHQIDQKEISYGTIGPSLWNYGKIRGNSQEMLQYTWNRINNSKAYNACSNMPRFGHFKVLSEKQIQDLMALLLDPQSPVNQ